MKTIGQESFKGQNWLITPVALAEAYSRHLVKVQAYNG
jgi:hypothetical protein